MTGLEKNIKTPPPQIVDSWTTAILDDGGVAAAISTPPPPYWHEKGAGKSKSGTPRPGPLVGSQYPHGIAKQN